MNLKSRKNVHYILNPIDMFSRFTKAEFIKDKLSSTIIDQGRRKQIDIGGAEKSAGGLGLS